MTTPTSESVKALVDGLTKPCLMCFGTGKTRRYRGPVREGPCIACDGGGSFYRAHLGASHE